LYALDDPLVKSSSNLLALDGLLVLGGLLVTSQVTTFLFLSFNVR